MCTSKLENINFIGACCTVINTQGMDTVIIFGRPPTLRFIGQFLLLLL